MIRSKIGIRYLTLCMVCLVAFGTIHQFCPVSNHNNGAVDHHYKYPTMMYSDVALLEVANIEPFNCSIHNFTASTVDDMKICPNNKELCPVTKTNIVTAMHIAEWPQYAEAIYRIENSTASDKIPHELNIFYLGGSMTHGSQTYGACVCNKDIDRRCPGAELPYTEGQCSWPTMFTSWIMRQFPWVKFHFHDFSNSGLNSKLMSEQFSDLLREHVPGAQLTANDIVLVDHSANDQPQHPLDIQQGFELLIRRLLHATGTGGNSNSAENSNRPTIIVMEQFPKGQGYRGPPDVVHKVTDYAHTYRRVSRHYQVILWSLREVYWTYNNFTTVVAATQINLLANVANANNTSREVKVRMYQNNPNEHEIHGVTHPPWFIHLFIADVLAGCLLHTMSLLTQARNLQNPAASKLQKLYITSATPGFTTCNVTLPAPLFNINEISEAVCDNTQPFLLDAHPNTTFHPVNVHQYETDTTYWHNGGWRPYIDFHEVPGWIINDLADPTQRKLVFTMADTPAYVGKRVKIVYLKSYVGMGKAVVWICGDYALQFHHIDALYHDYESYQYSVPEIYIHPISGGEGDRCSALPADKRTIEIEFDSSRDHLSEVRKVHHQKFKVLSVEVCSDAPHDV